MTVMFAPIAKKTMVAPYASNTMLLNYLINHSYSQGSTKGALYQLGFETSEIDPMLGGRRYTNVLFYSYDGNEREFGANHMNRR